MRLAATVATALLVFAFLPSCGSDEPPLVTGSEATQTQPEESPEEERRPACLGKKKGQVVEIAAGDVKDNSQFADYRFSPTKFTLPAGEFVTFKVTNPTSFSHTFTVESLDCDTGYFEPDETVFVSFKVPPGTTPFRCVPHSVLRGDDTSGMAGEIIAK